MSQKKESLRASEKPSTAIFNIPRKEGTMEMRDEVFSSAGAQDMVTSAYQVSDLEYINFHWEDPDLNMDVVFRLVKDTPFSLSTFNNFEMGSMAENPIPIDDEQDSSTSSSNNSGLRETNPAPRVDEKSPL